MLLVLLPLLLPAEVKASDDKNVFEFVASLVSQLIPFPFVSTNSRNLQQENVMASEYAAKHTNISHSLPLFPWLPPTLVCPCSPPLSRSMFNVLLCLGAFAKLNTLKIELGLGNFRHLRRFLERDVFISIYLFTVDNDGLKV